MSDPIKALTAIANSRKSTNSEKINAIKALEAIQAKRNGRAFGNILAMDREQLRSEIDRIRALLDAK